MFNWLRNIFKPHVPTITYEVAEVCRQGERSKYNIIVYADLKQVRTVEFSSKPSKRTVNTIVSSVEAYYS